MMNVGAKTIHDYGKSMYGGWYANYFDNEKGEYDGYHARTLNELCETLQVNRKELISNVVRYDN